MGGGFSLRANHRRVIIRGIELKTRRAALYGKVGTEELKLANAAKLISRPNGIVLAQGLRLSAHAAARLNQLLRLPHFFKPCLPLAVSISHLGDQQATVIPAHRRPGVDRPDQRLDARPCLAEIRYLARAWRATVCRKTAPAKGAGCRPRSSSTRTERARSISPPGSTGPSPKTSMTNLVKPPVAGTHRLRPLYLCLSRGYLSAGAAARLSRPDLQSARSARCRAPQLNPDADLQSGGTSINSAPLGYPDSLGELGTEGVQMDPSVSNPAGGGGASAKLLALPPCAAQRSR